MPLSPTPARSSPSIRVDPLAGRIQVTGALDRRTAPLLHDALTAVAAAGRERWLVDVSGLVACDHDGLRAIGAAYRRALRCDCRLVLLGTPPWLARALARLRLDVHLRSDGPGRERPDVAQRDRVGESTSWPGRGESSSRGLAAAAVATSLL